MCFRKLSNFLFISFPVSLSLTSFQSQALINVFRNLWTLFLLSVYFLSAFFNRVPETFLLTLPDGWHEFSCHFSCCFLFKRKYKCCYDWNQIFSVHNVTILKLFKDSCFKSNGLPSVTRLEWKGWSANWNFSFSFFYIYNVMWCAS